MQHVKPKWLHIYNYVQAFLDVCIIVAYFLSNSFGIASAGIKHWGILTTVVVVATIHLIYIVSVYQFVWRKNIWIAHAISQMIFGILISSIIETTNNTNLVFRLSFVVFVFFLNMIGPYLTIAAIALAWMLLLFTVLSLTTPTHASLLFNIVIDSMSTLVGLGGWLFFRKYYIKDKETLALTSRLEQEQFKTNIIFESITDGVMMISPKGTVQVINKSCADMLGWERSEAKNLDYRSLFSVESETDKQDDVNNIDAISQTVKTGKSVQKVSLIKTHHDKHIYVDIVASPIVVETDNSDDSSESKLVGVVAVLRNVDTQKRQEQQRSDFISTASHEMRTPVASIQGFIELALNEKVATIDNRARDYLTKAHESTKHLGELFQDLLTASKSDDGRLVNHPELIDVVDFLKKVVEQTAPRAQAKGLQLIFDQAQIQNKPRTKSMQPLLYVNVDPERLNEIVTNLVENALKYTEKGVITVGVSLNDSGVVIRVSDTGIGIATEDIPHLFQKFYRTDNSVTREVGGTGLGLYITRQIAQMLGGKVWVESNLGTGSTFYVQLPRVSPDQVALLKQQKEQPVNA